MTEVMQLLAARPSSPIRRKLHAHVRLQYPISARSSASSLADVVCAALSHPQSAQHAIVPGREAHPVYLGAHHVVHPHGRSTRLTDECSVTRRCFRLIEPGNELAVDVEVAGALDVCRFPSQLLLALASYARPWVLAGLALAAKAGQVARGDGGVRATGLDEECAARWVAQDGAAICRRRALVSGRIDVRWVRKCACGSEGKPPTTLGRRMVLGVARARQARGGLVRRTGRQILVPCQRRARGKRIELQLGAGGHERRSQRLREGIVRPLEPGPTLAHLRLARGRLSCARGPGVSEASGCLMTWLQQHTCGNAHHESHHFVVAPLSNAHIQDGGAAQASRA